MSIYFYYFEDELLYIGSSMNIEHRKSSHKCDYKTGTLPFYRDVKANGLRMEDLQFKEIKTKITEKKKLVSLEKKYIIIYKPACNKNIPARTRREYREDNKEQMVKYRKEWYEINKEQKKQYAIANKEKIRERQRLYYLKKKAEQQAIEI